jgi:hypothetical protein
MQIVRIAPLFLLVLSLQGQTFRGGIFGVVTDSSGAAIAGASIKLDSAATGLSRAAITSTQGEYLFVDLPVGKYTLVVSQAGFETHKVELVEVAVSKTTNLEIRLASRSNNK